MSEYKARRGRPKGSEIDDSGQLRAIAALMRDDPDLKPTTAIRSLGISDPSTIRRLRDKFNSRRDTLLAPETAAKPISCLPRNNDAEIDAALAAQTAQPDIQHHRVVLEAYRGDGLKRSLREKKTLGSIQQPRQSHRREATEAGPAAKSVVERKGTSPRTDLNSTASQADAQQSSSGYVEPCMRDGRASQPMAVMAAWWSIGFKAWAHVGGAAFAMSQKAISTPEAKTLIRQQIEINNVLLDAYDAAFFQRRFN